MKDFQAVRKRILQSLRKNSKPLLAGGQLLIFPLLIFILFLGVSYIHTSLNKELAKYDLSSFSQTAPIAPYPLLHSLYTPYLTAEAAAVMDDESKVFLFVKNPHIRFSMASTTKLMTALVALEEFSLQDVLFIYSDGIEGSTVGLRKGEQYTLESLLYAMLLPSANDAAYAIADNYPGGREAFIMRMNGKAQELHLVDTKYDDPAGLEDDGNFTTAIDLAYLSSLAIKNEQIAEVTGTRQKVIADISGTHVIPLENLNKLLGGNGVVGIKTGFTQGAGGVLTTAKKEEGHLLILVVMRSLDRFADTEQLLRYVSGNVTYTTPSYAQDTVKIEGLTP
jgi:D-alanyl-D-alanine carboxypeptidase (penicillin-binding protein 5/6)